MLDRIATWLEADAPARDGVNQFNMGYFIAAAKCGTVCSIAGAVVQFNQTDRGEPTYGPNDMISADIRASEILDLDFELANNLFLGQDSEYPYDVTFLEDITPAHAARCIRKLIDTGTVDWTGTR